jgi:hypothetical protein
MLPQTILSSFGWSDQIAKAIRQHNIKLSIGLQGPRASGASQASPTAPGDVREFAEGGYHACWRSRIKSECQAA